MRKYTLNEDYFENINTEEKAYWLGFLYADGCVHRHIPNEKDICRRNWIILELQDKDLGHLLRFNNDLGSNKTIVSRKKTTITNRVCLCSEKMCDDLVKYGCVPNKSLCLKFPENLNHNLYNHFIRGFFDGDGSVFKYNNDRYLKCKFISNKEFLVSINDILNKQAGVSNHITYTDKGEKVSYLSYQSKDDIKKIFDYLYKNSNIMLDRKYNVFKEYYIANDV